MGDDSPTVSTWAACSIDWTGARAAFFATSDGSWDEDDITTEGPGLAVLRLLPDRGIDLSVCTHAFGPIFIAANPNGAFFSLEHIDDVQKRVRIVPAAGITEIPFTLTLFGYRNRQ